MAVGIGSPPTTYNLILDSGSSVTWIKDEVYLPTRTSVNTRQRVKEQYGHALDDDDDDDEYDGDGGGDGGDGGDGDGDGGDGDGGDDGDDDDDGDDGGDDDKTYFQGLIWKDTLTIGGLTVTEFQLGIAEKVKGFQPAKARLISTLLVSFSSPSL
ncbi:hypothetical protein BDR04DRAFT_871503 [Suillus decipiens]|nr:hypothetical protein BDR04DRAFT_871503 [Suillus decipiens]